MADNTPTTIPLSQSLPNVVPVSASEPGDRCYMLRLNGHEVLVNAGDKGKPGDTVVLWPKKKCPVIVRRLARYCAYPGESASPAPLSARYYFAELGTGHMFDVATSKTAAIHKVVGDA